MKTRRIALTLLIMLVLILPVYTQQGTARAQEGTATVEPTAEAIDAATAEATETAAEVVVEPTEEATVEASETNPPETTPVAGVAEEPNDSEFNGASLLVLLVGLLAIGAVGFGSLVRSGFTPPQD